MTSADWEDFHLKTQSIFDELSTGGAYSEFCLQGAAYDRELREERESREEFEVVGSDGNMVSQPTRSFRGVPDTFILQQSLDILQWCLYATADMKGDKDTAWRHLKLAHKQAAVGYDYEMQSKLKKLKQLTSLFKEGYWPPPSFGMGSTTKIPVFIVGFFRSGSTLLETMLDAHRNVWGMVEETVFVPHVNAM